MAFKNYFVCRLFLVLIPIGLAVACGEKGASSQSKLTQPADSITGELTGLLTPLAREIEIRKDDWLDKHDIELQSIEQFILRTQDISPLQNIRLIKIGNFTPQQDSLFKIAGEYLNAYFGLDIISVQQVLLAELPNQCFIGDKINSSYLVNCWQPAYRQSEFELDIAICTSPITPSAQLSYAFGQASFEQACCVVSLAEFGKFKSGKPNFKFELLRMLKTLSHEASHSLGLAHCRVHECNMNGVNHLQELDRKPAYLCPACVSKLSWGAEKSEVKKRMERLEFFWLKTGFDAISKNYSSSLKLLDSF